MHECCTITIGHFNHGTCHCANQHHNFTLEITHKNTRRPPPYQQLCTAQTVSYAKSGGWMGGAAALKGCDFVVHHCPCLMEAWLLLSSCCDNAKCPFYECAKRAFAHCQRRPTYRKNTHQHNKLQVSLQLPHNQVHKAPSAFKTRCLPMVWKTVSWCVYCTCNL